MTHENCFICHLGAAFRLMPWWMAALLGFFLGRMVSIFAHDLVDILRFVLRA